MHMCRQWWLHCTSQWGQTMLLSEHVNCVAITFKVTEWVEQWIYIKVFVKLEHSSTQTIRMIQKATAMGNWWLAASSWQHICSCITSHPEFFGKTRIALVNQPTYSPDLVPWNFWLFSKLKSPLKGKRFQTIDEIQKNTTGQLMVIGRIVWGPKVPTLKGHHCPMYNVFCIFYLLQ